MYNTYSPPPGFCFDVLCADEPMIDDPDSPDYNIDRKVYNITLYSICWIDMPNNIIGMMY
jgi:lysosomal alpha-mannosidase